jgi:hypothetical protein
MVKSIKKSTQQIEMEKPSYSTKQKDMPKEKKKQSESKLPPDTYKDEIEPMWLSLDDDSKNFLVFSVKRQGDLGLPHVDVRHYVKTETYTGFTKKGINFPIDYLDEIMLRLSDVSEACQKKGL